MDNEIPPGSQPSGPTPPPVPPIAPPPPYYSPPPVLRPLTPQRRSSGGKGWMIVAIVLAVMLGFTLLGKVALSSVGASVGGVHAGKRGGVHALQPVMLEHNGASHDIMVIDVDGVITSQGADGAGRSLVDLIEEQLEIAKDSKRIKAVILKVNSPGGEVLASDDIYNLIVQFQEDSEKPVVAAMGALAASGGYYVSAPCRWIVANKLTITGSIGVIMSGYNFRGLMDKVGIHPEVFKSGKFKDMLSSTKSPEEVLPEERAMVMGLIMETYGQFTNIVATGRAGAYDASDSKGRKLVSNWADYADGRILTGTQAYELGFVDELGNFDAAVKATLKLADLEEANLVTYRMPFDLSNLFRLFGKTEATTVKIDLGVEGLKLKKGHLYFMAPTVL
jgi:protease IV